MIPFINPKNTDKRWSDRRSTQEKAILSFENLKKSDNEFLREVISMLAESTGFFSIWMTVFENDLDMKKRFIEVFKGTRKSYFSVLL